ncbi:MAG: uroporphyrinogen decarboxylase family protein [Candidatus Zhuqueibacterota bacterium]
MTPREQILTILNGQQPDRVPWFGDLDYLATALITKKERPADFKQSPDYIKWHTELGVGFYLQGHFPFRPLFDFEEKIWQVGNRKYRTIITPVGSLQECWAYIPTSYTEAPVEHLVKSERDLAALRFVYEHTRWQADYDFCYQRMEQIGDQGILLCYLPKSPFMQLVALEAGIESVTFSAMNAPDEFAETLAVMKQSFDQAAQIAVDSPAEALMIPENLSAEMVGPNFFEKFMRAYQQEWIEKIHAAGKSSFIHMDGTLKGLLRQESSTGVSVIEAMTPAPVGDAPIDDWAALANNPGTILWGGIPGSYFTPLISDDEFERFIRHALDVQRSAPRYVLGVADQVPPDGLEYRIRRVRELVDKFGRYTR